jgi:dTDP-4-amino-4,6-dideoxygalactose transaminase
MIRYFDLKRQDSEIRNDIDIAICNALDGMHFIKGGLCEKFEREFSIYNNTKYCLGTGNGLDALSLILAGLKHLNKIDPRKPILIPENTFIATALSAYENNLEIQLYKVKNNFEVCREYLSKINPNDYSLIIYVPLYGNFQDAGFMKAYAENNNLTLILDAAQAHGAKYNYYTAGSLGYASAFSFYPGKNLGCYGDGGAITTNDKSLFEICAKIGNYGFSGKYRSDIIGKNSRLDSLQAAILSCKMQYVDIWNEKRQMNCSYMMQNIDNQLIRTPNIANERSRHVGHVFAVRVLDRTRFQSYMFDHGVETNCHYPVHLRDQKCFENISDTWLKTHDTDTLVSLPCGPELTQAELHYIVDLCNRYT